MFVDWAKIIESSIGPLLGTLVGGGITIGGIVIKEYFDRRRAVQSWFVEHYVTEGLDVLISYFSTANYVLSGLVIEAQIKKNLEADLQIFNYEFPKIPWEALNRVSYVYLFNEARLVGAITAVPPAIELAIKLKAGGMATVATLEKSKLMVALLIETRAELVKSHIKHRRELHEIFTRKPLKAIAAKYKEKLTIPAAAGDQAIPK